MNASDLPENAEVVVDGSTVRIRVKMGPVEREDDLSVREARQLADGLDALSDSLRRAAAEVNGLA